ncbi:CpaF family protein [Marinobacter litoralis]|uniref:CpaF family protein n=1 Tax=Marinobacter litoralis TaxID=187981 RepID=UPI0018ED7715|nr:CpaF family protein [Marinobacter litoralis]MBJ6138920.1 CpaF family protein [Marinobacter litoralis]
MERLDEKQAPVLAKARQHIHKRLITSLDSDPLDVQNASEVTARVQALISVVSNQVGLRLTEDEREALANGVVSEVSGMGPLQPLMDDPTITDILVNGPSSVWVDRDGRLEQSTVQFDDEGHLRRFVDRFVGSHGKHLDSSNPAVDARLPDGSRLHAIIPPLSPVGTVVSIRRFRQSHASLNDLVANGMLSEAMSETLRLAVRSRMNIVFAGGAGAGKTTLLNAVSEFIPDSERIVTIEDSAELALRHHHVISLEGRQENSEGKGKHDLRSLLKHALRMRADRIIVGEVRGEEVFDMLQAMNIGHDGSLSTIHANNPEQALKRMETLALLSETQAPRQAIRDMVDAAVGMIVHVGRDASGSRRVLSMVELLAGESDRQLNELFRWERTRQGSAAFSCLRRPWFADNVLCEGLPVTERLLDLWQGLED